MRYSLFITTAIAVPLAVAAWVGPDYLAQREAEQIARVEAQKLGVPLEYEVRRPKRPKDECGSRSVAGARSSLSVLNSAGES